ncbi:MAG: YbjN domain-containing protein [Candidatus Thorarchaeota archaeon]
MGKRIEEITQLLDELEVKYELKDETIVALWKTEKWENLVVNFIFSPNDIWLTIVGWQKFPQLSKGDAAKFYKTLLQESWSYNGVKYCVDPDGDLAVVVETADTEISAEELSRYIRQVLNAADEMHDWVPSKAWKE